MTGSLKRGRPAPECLILDVRPGQAPSPKPPVRIFLGTEAWLVR